MGVALLTVDRGDRGPVFDFCLAQVEKMQGSFQHIVINYPPKSSAPDLTERVKEGIKQAEAAGATWVVIVESDDFYRHDYLHTIMQVADNADFIGCERTYYYNLKNRSWEKSTHQNHSSLFCTAFRVSAMKDFKWHKAHRVFLDLDIWRYARQNGYRRTFLSLPAIGIKGHGYGLVGGKGHVQEFPNKDPDMAWLKSKVSTDAYVFYQSLKLK